MASMTIRNLRDETKRGIQARAKRNGHSAEEEVRRILDQVVLPPDRVRIGSELAAIGKRFAGVELVVERDRTPARGVVFKP